MLPETNTCVLTGASSYVGRRLKLHLQRGGWQVREWSRQSGAGQTIFALGKDVEPAAFDGATALVHCAYDFKARGWEEILATNVRGSELLFQATRAAGVKQVVFVSSASAFAECRSRYGRAKLEIETIAEKLGAVVVRPGLVYGDQPGGVFGKLVAQVKSSRLLPLIGRGQQKQYLVHDADLGAFVLRALSGSIPADSGPILLAHEEPQTMRQLLEKIAALLGKKPQFIPIPWRALWLGLKALETAGMPTAFRSDSLVSLIYQNPCPSFKAMHTLGIQCRPFALTPQMVA